MTSALLVAVAGYLISGIAMIGVLWALWEPGDRAPHPLDQTRTSNDETGLLVVQPAADPSSLLGTTTTSSAPVARTTCERMWQERWAIFRTLVIAMAILWLLPATVASIHLSARRGEEMSVWSLPSYRPLLPSLIVMALFTGGFFFVRGIGSANCGCHSKRPMTSWAEKAKLAKRAPFFLMCLCLLSAGTCIVRNGQLRLGRRYNQLTSAQVVGWQLYSPATDDDGDVFAIIDVQYSNDDDNNTSSCIGSIVTNCTWFDMGESSDFLIESTDTSNKAKWFSGSSNDDDENNNYNDFCTMGLEQQNDNNGEEEGEQQPDYPMVSNVLWNTYVCQPTWCTRAFYYYYGPLGSAYNSMMVSSNVSKIVIVQYLLLACLAAGAAVGTQIGCRIYNKNKMNQHDHPQHEGGTADSVTLTTGTTTSQKQGSLITEKVS